MQKSHITFAPVSFYALRKQKGSIDHLDEEPPPVLTKGSETEFDNGDEPPPPLLEAETTADEPKNVIAQQGSLKTGPESCTVTISSPKNGGDAGEANPSTESFILQSRHLPSWLRNCHGCSACQNQEHIFRGRITGDPHSGPKIAIDCALCGASIYKSDCRWERPSAIAENSGTNDSQLVSDFSENEIKPSTSATTTQSADEIKTKSANGNNGIGANQNCSHQFGLNFPVMFEAKGGGQQRGQNERIAFRGFVYCHISRQVKTRGGGDSVSYWRCQQRIGPLNSNCTALVRLEGKNLTFVKGHKHPPDYATTRALLSHVHSEYTRLYSVSGRKGRTKNSTRETVALVPNPSPILFRPIAADALRRVTSQVEKSADNSTDEPATMETEELIRSITARKELLTVKVSPSTR